MTSDVTLALHNVQLCPPYNSVMVARHVLDHSPPMGRARSAIVIGAGIIGVTSAYALAKSGWHVRVVDPMPKVAMGASLGNGRQLSYSHTNALADPKLLPKMPGLALGCDPAFRISLKPSVGYWSWLLRFLGNSTSAAFRRNTLAVLKLAQESQQAMESLLERHSIEFERQKSGKLVLFPNANGLEAAREVSELKQAHGLRQNILTKAQAAEIEPALLQARSPIAGALYSPDDETGNCQLFAQELMSVLEASYGAQFLAGREAASVESEGSRSRVTLESGEVLHAQLVVLANGHHVNTLLGRRGERLPIEPMKGYSFTAPLGNSAPRVSITDSRNRIVFTNLGHQILVAGIAEMGRDHDAVEPERLASMVAAAKSVMPEAAVYAEASSGWAGQRPMTPNSQPIIRMLRPGLAVNAGHGMLGWTLAMGSAERLAKIVSAPA